MEIESINSFENAKRTILSAPKRWLITGCAGFIGSNLLETLLKLDQTVIGLDNFSTGRQRNLDDVKEQVSKTQWDRFSFINGDIREINTCHEAMRGVDYVLHQAALGSVPRSLTDPVTTNDVNVGGFLNMLVAARDGKVRSFIYAASSSTYGDHPTLPKVEEHIGKPLSPYAVTKYVNELYAEVFHRCYGFKTVGLRYFNVFGKRQDPNGAYAAVIPRWISSMIHDKEIAINGDGETSRDFCFVDNVVQANLLAATATSDKMNEIYNVAVGDTTTLNQLATSLRSSLESKGVVYKKPVVYFPFRPGDVRHSQADIGKASSMLGYKPTHTADAGLEITVSWYVDNAQKASTPT